MRAQADRYPRQRIAEIASVTAAGAIALFGSCENVALAAVGPKKLPAPKVEKAKSPEKPYRNPIMERTDKELKAVVLQIRNLKAAGSKNVEVFPVVMEDGSKVTEYVATAEETDKQGHKFYDRVVAVAYTKDPANQDVPFATRIVIGAKTKKFRSLEEVAAAHAIIGRGFKTELNPDSYYIDTYNGNGDIQDQLPLEAGPIMDPAIYNDLDQKFGFVTSLANNIVAKAGKQK